MRSRYLRWLKAVFFIIAAFLYCWLFVDHAQRPVEAWLAARKYVPVWWVSPLFFAPATALLALGCDLVLRSDVDGIHEKVRFHRPCVIGWAFVLAPFWAASIMSFAMANGMINIDNVFSDTAIIYFFFVTPSVLAGVLLYLVLNYFGKVNLITIACSGIGIGYVEGLYLGVPGKGYFTDIPSPAAAGYLSSMLFWVMWRRRYL